MYGITVVVIVLLSANVLKSTWNYGNKNMFFGGLATFLSAFILWNIGEHKCQVFYILFSNRASLNLDSHFCHNLENFRDTSSLTFLKPFSQLHGWWHILTGGYKSCLIGKIVFYHCRICYIYENSVLCIQQT